MISFATMRDTFKETLKEIIIAFAADGGTALNELEVELYAEFPFFIACCACSTMFVQAQLTWRIQMTPL
jgi:hypothetical protein